MKLFDDLVDPQRRPRKPRERREDEEQHTSHLFSEVEAEASDLGDSFHALILLSHHAAPPDKAAQAP
jgi:hypothetical protein